MKLGPLLCGWWLALPGMALATESPPFSRVALLLPSCELPGLTAGELRDAAALELQGEGLVLAAPGELAPKTDVLVRIDADCAGGGDVSLLAERDGQSQQRRVELRELAQTERARALALSLAELVAAFRHQPHASTSAAEAAMLPEAPPAPTTGSEAKPAPAVAPAPEQRPREAPKPADRDRLAERVEREPVRGALAAELRLFDGTALWGGRAQLERGSWSASSDVLIGKTGVPAGDVTSLLLQLNIAYDLRLLGRPAGTLLTVGPRVGAGPAMFLVSEQAGARGASALDVYVDAAISACLSLRASQALRFAIAAEVGYARGPVGQADGVEVARMAGPFTSLLLRASVEP